MTTLPEMTVATIATAAPPTIRVFRQHRIDFCCEGRIFDDATIDSTLATTSTTGNVPHQRLDISRRPTPDRRTASRRQSFILDGIGRALARPGVLSAAARSTAISLVPKPAIATWMRRLLNR